MRNRTGKPVRSTDFFDRDQELAELWHLVERDSVLMLAPRRVGKTSILLRMRDQPRDGWQCSFLNVEAVASEAQFMARLLTGLYELEPSGALWTRLGEGVRSLLGGIGKIGPIELDLTKAIGRDWQELGDILRRILGKLSGKTLVLIDELPIFVSRLLRSEDGEQRTRLFLDWLRMLRIDATIEDADVHFLIAGSIGLDAVVQRVGMTGTINDLVAFRLGPLREDQADVFLIKLGEGENLPLDADVRQRILLHITWPIPFHLQLIFDQLLRLVRFRGATLSPELVDQAHEALFASENRKHFSHWEERLQDPTLNSEERNLMRALLNAAAKDPNGVTSATCLQLRNQVSPKSDEQAALLALEYDGYLVLREQRWHFASSLLRTWWLRWQDRGTQ